MEYTKTPQSIRAAAESSLVGEVIDGKYDIISLLGAGGYGAVYKAEHTMVSRQVAVKVLHHCDPMGRERFRREAELISKISHPNVVSMHDYAVLPSGQLYFVMDLLEGQNLYDYVRSKGKLSVEETIGIAKEICAGLSAAHQANIIHRDLKPSNVVLARNADGSTVVKLVDFGLAKSVESEMESQLTKTGETIGTPQYMSPEQCMGQPAEVRTDLYALGCLMYEMLAGETWVNGDSVFECMQQQVNMPVPPFADELKVPDALVDIIMKALSKQPKDRFVSAEAMLEALNTVHLIKRRTRLTRREANLLRAGVTSFFVFCSFVLSWMLWQLWAPPTAGVHIDFSQLKWRHAVLGQIAYQAPENVHRQFAGQAAAPSSNEASELVEKYSFGNPLYNNIEVKEYPETTFDEVVKQGDTRHKKYAGYKSIVNLRPVVVGANQLPGLESSFYVGDKDELRMERHVYFRVGTSAYKIKATSRPPSQDLDELQNMMLHSVKVR